MASGSTPVWARNAGQFIKVHSKGFSLVLTHFAEPFMRYSTMYLAIATGISFVRVEALYLAAKAVVIIAPELVLIGALQVAEQALAKKNNWGWALIGICGLLAIIMILTFAEIFKVLHFESWQLNYLNLARCLVAVSFSIVLGKLEDEKEEVSTNPVVSPLATDHELLAQQLLPLLTPIFTKEIQELAGQFSLTKKELFDREQTMAEQTATLVRSVEEKMSGQMSTLMTAFTEHKATLTAEGDRTDDRLRADNSEPQSDSERGEEKPTKKRKQTETAREKRTSGDDQSILTRLLAHLEQHPDTTQKELAALFSVSERTIRRYLASLKQSGQVSDGQGTETVATSADMTAISQIRKAVNGHNGHDKVTGDLVTLTV